MKLKRLMFFLVPFLALPAFGFVMQPNKDVELEVKAETVENYEGWINSSIFQPNHLYIHYNRGKEATAEEYESYALWIWQHKPKDIEGSLWAYSGPSVVNKIKLNAMSTHFMYGSELGKSGDSTWIDQYGAIVDVDLGADIVPGKEIEGAKPGDASLTGATEIGFLMVKQDSMGGNTHWTSDGGKNTYVSDFDQHFREDNHSIHLFIQKGSFDDYTFESGVPEIKINPTTEDTTGKYSSQVENIVDKYSDIISPTADAFKTLGVGYQIFVASFRDSNGDGLGDLRGIIDALPELYEMGVQVLWLTPIQESDSYHGYDISDYYKVDPKFGTLNDYRELIYKAHTQYNMKVLMDLVLNHTSKSNVWFKASQWAKEGTSETGEAITWRNMYHWKYKTEKIKKYNESKGDWSTEITVEEDALSDNPSWYRDGESGYYYYGKFGSGMPEINYENQATRNIIKNMAKYWLSFGLDGFRLDAVKHIYMKDEVADTGNDVIIKDTGEKRSFDNEKGDYVTKKFDYSSDLNKNVQWWKEFAVDLKKVYPNCFLVGENYDGYGNRTAAYYQALDSQFGFNHYFHIPQSLILYGPGAYGNKEPNEGEAAFRSDWAEYWVDGQRVADLPGGRRQDFIDGSFTSNHDIMRAINHAAYSGTKQVGTMTETIDNTNITGTADQIGKAKLAAAVTLLTPGVSWIYYGDELGMSSNTNKHIELYGNENCEDIWYRQPYLWQDENIRANYSSGGYKIELDDYNKTIDSYEEQKGKDDSMLNFYKGLIEIKKQYPKNARVSYEWGENVIVFKINGQGGKSLVIYINTGHDSKNYSPNPGSSYKEFKALNGANAQNMAACKYAVLAYISK